MSEALARFFAGGRHVRLLIAGPPPSGLTIPPLDHFERVVQLGPGHVVADPTRLPFIEAMFDRALVTTPLPAASARAELREIWRTLAPAGLALFVIKARRPWQIHAPGWLKDDLAVLLADGMFETLDWQIDTIPDRHHLILVAKRDGMRPAMIGRVVEATVTAGAVT
jgi:SAM-dependent methyltransferase